MSKTFRPYDPDQRLLLPAALQEWLPPDQLAYFISDVVDQPDFSAITARYQGEERELGIHRATVRKYLDADGPPTRRPWAGPTPSSSDTMTA